MKKVIVKTTPRLNCGHLWIFANEVLGNLKDYDKGELVEIAGRRGDFIGTGYINPNTLIAVRILTRRKEDIGCDFFTGRIAEALAVRKKNGVSRFDGYRAVFGESDGLPGLIVDKYKNCLCVQTSTAGMERLLPEITQALTDIFSPEAIVLRNSTSFRELEGLPLENAICCGEVNELPVIEEDGVLYKVDILEGQKTGFFLDQRENRLCLRSLIKNDEPIKILDCFSYSGGWALSAAYGRNDDTTCVDISEKSVKLIEENAALNHKKLSAVKADIFTYLKEAERAKEKFDAIILDPPAFIKSRAKIKEGVKGYKEINLRAMKLLNPGGMLVTSSCSHHLGRDAFLELLRECSSDTGKHFKIIKSGGQSKDHPVLLAMPETEYLKTFFLQIAE